MLDCDKSPYEQIIPEHTHKIIGTAKHFETKINDESFFFYSYFYRF